MTEAVILSAVRTPIGRFWANCPTTAPRLGPLPCAEALKRAGVAADRVDEVIMGNVVQAASGRTRPGRRRSSPTCRTPSPLHRKQGLRSGLKSGHARRQAIRAAMPRSSLPEGWRA